MNRSWDLVYFIILTVSVWANEITVNIAIFLALFPIYFALVDIDRKVLTNNDDSSDDIGIDR